jgi:flagellar motor component MotA
MQGKIVDDQFGKYAPAFGMIGTLLGLIFMLSSMDDPSKIGPSMAVALITTLYGAIIANCLRRPHRRQTLRQGPATRSSSRPSSSPASCPSSPATTPASSRASS